jgi:PadR family transcriptional regulator, regulatory protein PadR
MADEKTDIPYGTLDLLVLRTLDAMGPMHGFGLARRIEQVAENLVQLNQGSIYPALLRLQHRRWITSKWGVSENGRRARFYSLTPKGKKELESEIDSWERATALVNRFLQELP